MIKNKNVQQCFRVAVEGNISAGKTSFIEYFQQYLNVDIHVEPIKHWTNYNGNNLLKLLYSDLKRWNFLFQNFVQLNRFKMQISPPKSPKTNVQIFERSIQNNLFCFGKMAYEEGFLTEAEYLVNQKWYEVLNDATDLSVDLIVYIRCDPKCCYDRLKLRGRPEEQNVSLEYLQNIHRVHDEWLISPNSNPGAPVLIIDNGKGYNELLNEYENNKDIILGLKPLNNEQINLINEETEIKMNTNKTIRITVEGNIGSGKTTLLNYLKNKNLPLEICNEPLEKWCNLNGHNLLKLLYTDLKRWNYLFRSYVQLTFLQNQIACVKHNSTRLLIFERSIQSNRYCFVEHAFESNYLTKTEYDVLLDWYETIEKLFNIQNDITIYLRCDPKICHQRILKRERHEEREIPLEYIETLNRFHEKWLFKPNDTKTNIIIVNNNFNISNEMLAFEKCYTNLLQCLTE